MPSRFWTLAILAFWLATMGWFGYATVWPRLRPGERPPFTVDLSEEVAGPWSPRQWKLYRNGRRVGYANTWVTYHRSDDTYTIMSKYGFHPLDLDSPDSKDTQTMTFSFMHGLVRVQADSMESCYRVNRDGDLRALKAEVKATVFAPDGQHYVEAHVTGSVAGGYLEPHWELKKPFRFERTTEPVPVASNHSILNPLQPWDRLHNIRPGQSWRVQLFDPLTEAATTAINSFMQMRLPRVEYLDAVVQPLPQDLAWANQEVPCLVVEYRDVESRGEKIHAYTWVRQSDGLVLRQEATRDENTPQREWLTLERNL